MAVMPVYSTSRLSRWAHSLRRLSLDSPSTVFWIVIGLNSVLAVLALNWPSIVGSMVFFPLFLVNVFWLTGVRFQLAMAFTLVAYASTAMLNFSDSPFAPGSLLGFAAALALIVYMHFSVRETQIPLVVSAGMISSITSRFDQQCNAPKLPRDYRVEAMNRPAQGGNFSGDFTVVAQRRPDYLEYVLVDISGHGQAGGSKAMLLQGAFASLLGEVPIEEYLPACNRYLLRQGWSENIVSAVHVAIDLTTGHYSVGSAGHPPFALYNSGAGTWRVSSGAEGIMLGVLSQDTSDYVRAKGYLHESDAIMLYTDGMVESSTASIEVGIRSLLSAANRAVEKHGMRGRWVESVFGVLEESSPRDDASMVIIRRVGANSTPTMADSSLSATVTPVTSRLSPVARRGRRHA